MSKTPKYKGITTQWVYNTRQIDKFIKSRRLENFMIENDLRKMIHNCLEHSKKLSRAYKQTHKHNENRTRQAGFGLSS